MVKDGERRPWRGKKKKKKKARAWMACRGGVKESEATVGHDGIESPNLLYQTTARNEETGQGKLK